MQLTERHKLVWGWLRLLLGLAQMALAAAGVMLLLTRGLTPVTLIVMIGATVATLVSRVIYRGRADWRSRRS